MEEQDKKGALELTVVNSATGQPVVYSGETDALLCTLTNNTGGPIGLLAGNHPSKLEIYLPDFYQQDDRNKMQISLDGWDFEVNSKDESLMLTCTKAGSWASGAALSFQITGAQSSKTPPQGGPTQIDPSAMTGTNIRPQVQTDVPLSLQQKPDGNKADLRLVLEPGLKNEGKIYISLNEDLLISNSLFLTLKNKGTQPLFPGPGPWPTIPKALVWFVYGNTAGALAPDDKATPEKQSAWNIQVGDVISEGNSWSFGPVSPKGKDPKWSLTPNSTNPGILGTDDEANVTFEFTQVVSHTPVGHTQMYVQCSGFPGYSKALFVLDIDKRELPSPGLIHFTSNVDKVTVHSPNDKVTIQLSWTMTGVSKITLDFSPLTEINLNSSTESYTGDQPPLQNGSYRLEFSGLEQSATLIVTCKAYDDHNNQLNDCQQTVVLDFPPVVTSYTGQLQPDGSLLLSWTTLGATKVEFSPDLSSQIFGASGHFPVPKPKLPLLRNNLYALTAKNDQGEKSAPRVFTTTTTQKFVTIGGIGGVPFGIAVSPDSSHVFVTNMQDNNVSIIEVNLNNNPAFRVLPTRVATGRYPVGIAVSPDGKYVFVGNGGDNSVTVFGGIPPFQPFPGPVPAGYNAYCLAVSPDGRYAFVPNNHQDGGFALSVIDTANGPSFQVIQGPTLGSVGAVGGIAASPGGAYVFLSVFGSNLLLFVQVEAGANPPYKAVPPAVTVGDDPRGVAVSPDGHYVFVANCSGVSVIEASSRSSFQVSPPVLPGDRPRPLDLTVSRDGRFLFVTDQNNDRIYVWVIDENSHPPLQFFQTLSVVGRAPNPVIVASPDGHSIFLTGGDSTILVIEAVEVSM